MTRRVDDALYLGICIGVLGTALAIRAAQELRRIANEAPRAHREGGATR
jgi:hypothetical protein